MKGNNFGGGKLGQIWRITINLPNLNYPNFKFSNTFRNVEAQLADNKDESYATTKGAR